MAKRVVVGRLGPGKGSITLNQHRLRSSKDLGEAGFLPLMQRGLQGPEYLVYSSEDFESNSVTISWFDEYTNKENN